MGCYLGKASMELLHRVHRRSSLSRSDTALICSDHRACNEWLQRSQEYSMPLSRLCSVLERKLQELQWISRSSSSSSSALGKRGDPPVSVVTGRGWSEGRCGARRAFNPLGTDVGHVVREETERELEVGANRRGAGQRWTRSQRPSQSQSHSYASYFCTFHLPHIITVTVSSQ